MFSPNPQIRRFSIVAWRDPAPASRPAEETRPLRGASQNSLSGCTQALRIYPDTEGSRPLSDHHVDRALGQHPHGRLAWTAAAARTQELQEDVRSRNGLLRMR